MTDDCEYDDGWCPGCNAKDEEIARLQTALEELRRHGPDEPTRKTNATHHVLLKIKPGREPIFVVVDGYRRPEDIGPLLPDHAGIADDEEFVAWIKRATATEGAQ